METVKEYNAHVDSKKRITLRGASYGRYHVREFANGCIVLEPRELMEPDSISAGTLSNIDLAVENFRLGEVSPTVDLSDF